MLSEEKSLLFRIDIKTERGEWPFARETSERKKNSKTQNQGDIIIKNIEAEANP